MNAPADRADSALSDNPDSDTPSGADAEIGVLIDEVGALRRALIEMKEIALAEMRMTRLLVGTLVDQGNEDHAALLRFANSMIQKMYANSALLTLEDQQDLERKEDLFVRLNRMELERGIEPQKVDEKTEEILR
ncbi:hypothetical protein [Tateyamaria sp. syn59]|uniref:hypothetical protein n=1 Tax=Tateyamaria sp. syn59 TaxID=2576942 RepID=UPI0011BFCDF7|nr:hypothetical protein [Tateyamaria sp. syn59]